MNPELYDKKYPVPLPIIEKLKAKLMTSDGSEENGVKRAKFLINNGYATYQMMKRIKNFFDNFDQTSDSIQEYELSGGKEMHDYIDHTLDADRGVIATSKKTKEMVAPDLNRNIKAVSESEERGVSGKTEQELNLNAVVVLMNENNRVLLLQRSSYPDQWMPNKWSMPGGAIEKGEDPKEAAKRELKEETGLVVDDFSERFVIQRDDENVEHVFLGKYEGDPLNVKLDKENQAYGWIGKDEVESLDSVPNLMDYINIAIKKYD